MATRADQLLSDAGHAAARGEWRLCADKYLASTRAAPPDWPHRWYAFSGYGSLVASEKRFEPTDKANLKVLRKFSDAEAEPALFRTAAAFWYGLMKWDAHERESAARSYRRSIEMGARATADERARPFFHSERDPAGGPPIKLKLAGELIDYYVRSSRENLHALESPHGWTGPPIEERTRADGTVVPNDVRVRPVPPSEDLAERLLVGGTSCDHCQRTAAEAGLERLLLCNRCKMAYYCSARCQRAQWGAGHRESCRAPGQVEVGDVMLLSGLQARPELNELLVRVLGPVAEREGRWRVKLITPPRPGSHGPGPNAPALGASLSIATEKLNRIRPAV